MNGTDMYAKFAEEAREEGFMKLAKQFEMVGQIEKEHEERYKKLLENIKKWNSIPFRRKSSLGMYGLWTSSLWK